MKTSTVSTGLSDFHKMIITVMRTTFPKAEPTVITYRKMSNYNSDDFSKDLEEKLKGQPFTYAAFEKTFLETLEIHAPQKTKTVRANNKPYLNKV